MKHVVIVLVVIALAAACKKADKTAEQQAAEQPMSDSVHMMSPTSEMEITDSSTVIARDKAKKY